MLANHKHQLDVCGAEANCHGQLFAHDNEINILKDQYNQVDVTRDCKPIPPPAVYTLPELDEDLDEDNTEM